MSLTQKQLAGFLGYTDRQLRNFRKDGMPLDLGDPLVVAKCAVWIHENAQPYMGGWNTRKGGNDFGADGGDVNAQIKQATLRKLEEEVRAKRLENEATEGNLLSSEAVERRVSEWVMTIRSHLMQLGTDLATIVPGELKGVVKKAAEDKVRTTLLLLHEDGVRRRNDSDGDDD